MHNRIKKEYTAAERKEGETFCGSFAVKSKSPLEGSGGKDSCPEELKITGHYVKIEKSMVCRWR